MKKEKNKKSNFETSEKSRQEMYKLRGDKNQVEKN